MSMTEEEVALFKGETDRIDKAEQAIVGLSGRMDGFDNRMHSVEQDTSETKRGVNLLLQRTGGIEAQKGMVPIGQIWSAIGAMLTILTIGLAVLWNYDGQVDTKLSKVVELENARHKTVNVQVEHLNNNMEADNLREISDKQHFEDIQIAIAQLEVKVDFALKEIGHHTNEKDHPLLQTKGLENLQKQFDHLRDSLKVKK